MKKGDKIQAKEEHKTAKKRHFFLGLEEALTYAEKSRKTIKNGTKTAINPN